MVDECMAIYWAVASSDEENDQVADASASQPTPNASAVPPEPPKLDPKLTPDAVLAVPTPSGAAVGIPAKLQMSRHAGEECRYHDCNIVSCVCVSVWVCVCVGVCVCVCLMFV